MKSVRINTLFLRNILLIGIIFLFAFYPGYFEHNPIISKFDFVINLFIVVGVFFYFIYYKKIQPLILFICFFVIYQLFSTIWNHADLKIALWGQGVLFIAMCGSIQWGMNFNEKLFIKTIYYLFSSLLLINFFSLLLWPEGLYIDQRGIQDTNYLLGNYNGFIIYMFSAILSGYLYLRKYPKRITVGYICLWGISFVSLFLKRSLTSLVGLSLLLIYMIFFNYQWTRWFLNIKSYVIGNLLFFYFFVWNTANNKILEFVTIVLDKDITFTGRTFIWSNAKSYIAENWLLGNGIEKSEVIAEKIGIIDAVNIHNLYLDILYDSGLIGFCFIAIFFIILLRGLKQLKDNKVRYFVEALLGILMLMCQFEAYNIKFIFFIIVFLNLYACRKENKRMESGE